jgi:hypothetical protein
MPKAASELGFKRINSELMSKEMFKDKIDTVTGKPIPSFARQAGLKMFLPPSRGGGTKAENIASRWLETGGNIPYLSPVYSSTVGKGVRMSNRMYLTFLNHLNANRFEFIVNRAREMAAEAAVTGQGPREGILGGMNLKDLSLGPLEIGKWTGMQGHVGLKRKYTPDEALNLDPMHNLVLAREIAEFTNAATGHGTAKNALEKGIQAIGPVLFSPGLLTSRVRLINPHTYMMSSPYVRKQYAKAAIGALAGWAAFTTMAKLAAEASGEESEINTDWTSSDFGKFRIGNTRLDFGGGFLQYAVLFGRLMEGGWTSSSNPQEGLHKFGEGFQAETQLSNFTRFVSNKLNPISKFAWDWFNASEGQPFQVMDRTAQMFVPLFTQDLYEMLETNPELLPWMLPVAMGAGTQTYGRTRDYLGKGEGKFIHPENDITITGGGPMDWFSEAAEQIPEF